MPHIRMAEAAADNDWRTWGPLLLLALAAGAVGYFILPLLP